MLLLIPVFKPLLQWLNTIYTNITQLEVPMSAHPFDIGHYLGVFVYLVLIGSLLLRRLFFSVLLCGGFGYFIFTRLLVSLKIWLNGGDT